MAEDIKPTMQRHSIAFYVILGAALIAFIRSFSLLSPILLAFLLMMLIALALNPLISRIRVYTRSRRLAVALVLGVLVAFLALLSFAFFTPIKDSAIDLSEELPRHWQNLQKTLIKMERKAVISEKKLQAEVAVEIAKTGPEAAVQPKEPAPEPEAAKPPAASGSLLSNLSDMGQAALGSFFAIAFNGTHILVVLVTVFFGVFFTLMDPRPIVGAVFRLVPEQHHDRTRVILQRIGKFAPAWVGSLLVSMVAIGLLTLACMWPIFGFKDALFLGLIAGMMEAVPYMGPILSAVPALLLALSQGGMTPLWVLLVYLGIHALESNVIQPFVVASGMKVHPVAVFFSLLICVTAFGILGVLIAGPAVAIVDILHDELYRKRYLPTVTDADLDRLAGDALHEKP